MSPRWKMAIPVALASGCFSVPPYEPENAVSYTQDGTGALVAGKDFALHFASGEGFHFPDALKIDGDDVMGHEPTRGCFREDETGLLIAPTPRISAHGAAEPVKSLLVPVLRGPAVAQARVEWSTRFSCNNITRSPGGTSTFTVFPDGRIVRYDTLSDPSSDSVAASECACDPSGVDFTVSTFWTLARSPLSALYRSDMTGPQDVPDHTDGPINNTDKQCVDDGTRQVAFAWRQNKGTAIYGSENLVSFGFEFWVHTSQLELSPKVNSSALYIERGGCIAAFGRAEQHNKPAPLSINGSDAMFSERDGIYGGDGGDGGDGGELGIELQSGRAELTGAVPGSFAVWLRFPGAVDAVRATREGAKGAWYLPQQVDDRSWIVWFRDPLLAGQTIAIEPR